MSELRDVYDQARPLDLEIDLSPDDWDLIRNEGRSINQSNSGCVLKDFSYTYVHGEIRVDGKTFPDSGIRKKGYLGSLSVLKPSLRIDFAKYMPGSNLYGAKELTLNNSRSDSSYLRQCLAYAIFEKAGVAASRCAFAHVRLNDQPLGLYVNVEPVKKPFLRRAFGDDEGNLYEGNSGSDFRLAHLERFEKKTHEDDPDRSDLDAIRIVLEESSDEELESRLESVLDLEQFLRFWAVETLVSHWDGYAGDLNNFLVYVPSRTGLLKFIPWGTDGAFQTVHPFLPTGERPKATFAWAALPNRLYAYGPTRARYHEELRRLLDEVWDETKLLEKLDSMVSILGDDPSPSSVMSLRSFVQKRRSEIETELAEPDVPWTLGTRMLRTCRPETLSHVSGRFSTTWDSLMSDAASEDAELEISLNGEPQIFDRVIAGAGAYGLGQRGPRTAAIRMTGFYPDGRQLVAQFGFAGHPFEPGTLPFHGFETPGFVTLRNGSGASTTLIAYIGEGSLTLDEASTEPGGSVEGFFDGTMVQLGVTMR